MQEIGDACEAGVFHEYAVTGAELFAQNTFDAVECSADDGDGIGGNVVGEELLDHIIEVASGRAAPAAVRLGQDDFIPWKRGVSL